MSFKKITISIPENLYKESMRIINQGLFSNFSDLVRSGIREEFKNLKDISKTFDEKYIYSDKKLIKEVNKSRKSKEGTILKTDKEMDEYLNKL